MYVCMYGWMDGWIYVCAWMEGWLFARACVGGGGPLPTATDCYGVFQMKSARLNAVWKGYYAASDVQVTENDRSPIKTCLLKGIQLEQVTEMIDHQ